MGANLNNSGAFIPFSSQMSVSCIHLNPLAGFSPEPVASSEDANAPLTPTLRFHI